MRLLMPDVFKVGPILPGAAMSESAFRGANETRSVGMCRAFFEGRARAPPDPISPKSQVGSEVEMEVRKAPNRLRCFGTFNFNFGPCALELKQRETGEGDQDGACGAAWLGLERTPR